MSFEQVLQDVFPVIATVFEVMGTLAMTVGFLIALWLAFKALNKKEGINAAFNTLRLTMGGAILLGLEILVAADLVRTITSNPSMEDAVILGIIVLIRTVLSMSIQIEIDGVLPWKRALIKSGASVVADQVKKSNAPGAATE